jgi:hypothetical protein
MSNEKDPVASVRRAEGGSRKAVPPDVVPERVQVPENLSPNLSSVESKDGCDVLHQRVARSKLAKNPCLLSPKDSLGMTEPLALAGVAGALAGEAADDEVDSLHPSSVDCPDIVEDRDSGPAELEDRPSISFALAEPCVVQPGKVQPVVEQAATAEQRSDIHALPTRSGRLPRTGLDSNATSAIR